MTVHTIPEELGKLREASERLSALEAAGVDNWEGYDDALAILRGEDPYDDVMPVVTVLVDDHPCGPFCKT